LRVSASGFYAWQQRPESARAARDRQLRVAIRASHEASHRHYGRPRVWKDLREAGEQVSEKRGARLMRAEGLRARPRKRVRSTTMSEHDQPVAANLLDRQFAAARPNQRWVGDTTELVIGSSAKLYLAAILDLYSRFIVGWALSAVNDRHLTLRVLEICPEDSHERTRSDAASQAVRSSALRTYSPPSDPCTHSGHRIRQLREPRWFRGFPKNSHSLRCLR
jgi:transposase InsO family protein